MRAGALSRHGGSGWWWGLSPGGLLRTLLARRGTIEAPLLGAGSDDLELIRATRSSVPILLNDAAALQIILCVRAARAREGAMAEAGVLMGGSARLICEAKGRAILHLFDIFETLQASPGGEAQPLEADTRSHFGEVCGSRETVERLLAPYAGVRFHEGLFPATAAGLEKEEFSFVHLDLDLPQSTGEALEFFYPRLVAGGILIGDDYHDAELREVFDSFVAGRRDTVIRLPWGQIMIVRLSA